MSAAKQGDAATVARLIDGGADVNAANDGGATALMFAALGGDPMVTSLLVRAGARTDIKAKLATGGGVAARLNAVDAAFHPLREVRLLGRDQRVDFMVVDHQGEDILAVEPASCPTLTKGKFAYDHGEPVERLVLNPDVVVRSRGVMEKCTFCVQRIEATRIAARNDNRPVEDGEVMPACAQTCPSQAIHEVSPQAGRLDGPSQENWDPLLEVRPQSQDFVRGCLGLFRMPQLTQDRGPDRFVPIPYLVAHLLRLPIGRLVIAGLEVAEEGAVVKPLGVHGIQYHGAFEESPTSLVLPEVREEAPDRTGEIG